MEKNELFEYIHSDTYAGNLNLDWPALEGDFAQARLVIRPVHLNPSGVVHGGCLFTMADVVAGSAAHSYGNVVTTTQGQINYLKAVVDVPAVTATARLLNKGRKILVYEVRFTDDDNVLYATATFTYYNLSIPIERLRDGGE